jgi:hypothetical protein
VVSEARTSSAPRVEGRGIESKARRRLLLALLTFGLAVGCSGSGGDGEPATGNLFENPGFEEGAQPWFSLDSEAWGAPFTVSTEQARSGTSSGRLELRSEDGGSARVYGIVQEVTPEALPEVLSGAYYVERWEQGMPKQYLQFVVIVWGADNAPVEVGGVENYQLRYVLAGVDAPPLSIANARYVMVDAGAPAQGRWVTFERNVRQDFEDLWGAAPEGFDSLRVLFEVRWDDRSEADGLSAADVYYDDLYLGPPAAD